MARIQKIESDSSFQFSQILEGTFLTYKTYQNGRVVHKAKLANGNVVEINPQANLSDYYNKSQTDRFISRILNYKQVSQSLNAVDRDFLICIGSLTITLPKVQAGYLIGISTGSTGNNVQVLADAGDFIFINNSDSTAQGISIGQNFSSILLYGTQTNWIIADITVGPRDINGVITQVETLLQNYYTKNQIDSVLSNSYYNKEQINNIVSGLASDSLITSLQMRIGTLQTIPVVHNIESQGAISIQSNSGYISLQLSVDSNAFSIDQSILYTNLTIAKLGTPQQGFAATYQLQGANGEPLGNKINIIQDIFLHDISFIPVATQQDYDIDSTVIIGDPYLKFVCYVQSDSLQADYKSLYVPVKQLVNTFTAGAGLQLLDTQLSIKQLSDSQTLKYLNISSDGLGIKGIDQKFQEYYNIEQIDNLIEALSNSISQIIQRLGQYYTKTQINNSFYNKTYISNNYYTKSQTNTSFATKATVNNLSNSFHNFKTTTGSALQQLSNSISTLKQELISINNKIGNLSDSTVAQALSNKLHKPVNEGSVGNLLGITQRGIQWISNQLVLGSYASIQFSQLNSNSKAVFQGKFIIIGIQSPTGNYYPIQKGSLYLYSDSNQTMQLDMHPYLAYQNTSQFTGTWKAYLPIGPRGIDGQAPTIGEDGYWYINGINTNITTNTQYTKWIELSDSQSVIQLSGNKGARQRLLLQQDCTIIPPTLSIRYPQLTLQIIKTLPQKQFTVANVTLTTIQTTILSWYWDGATTRRLPNTYLGD